MSNVVKLGPDVPEPPSTAAAVLFDLLNPTHFGFFVQKSLFGAPVALAQAADGALLITDDVRNSVWSVTAKGK